MKMKKGIAFYLNVLAALLGVVGVILTIYSSTMTADNGLSGLTMLVIAGIVGILLVGVAIYAPTRWGNHNPVAAISVLAAIVLYAYVFGAAAIQRVMLIAGLFSFNAANVAGWNVFYVSLGAWGCLLVGILLLVIGSFLKSVKEPKAA